MSLYYASSYGHEIVCAFLEYEIFISNCTASNNRVIGEYRIELVRKLAAWPN